MKYIKLYEGYTDEDHLKNNTAFSNQFNKLKHLEWIKNNGYSIIFEKGENKDGCLKYIDNGFHLNYPYTFRLINNWNKEKFLNFLNEYENLNENDFIKLCEIMNWDIDNLEIYNHPINSHYEIFLNNEEIYFSDILDYLDYNGIDKWKDNNIRVNITESNDYNNFPIWSAYTPYNISEIPEINSDLYNKICEWGLFYIKIMIVKLMGSSDSKNYKELLKKDFSNLWNDDLDILKKYLNYSNFKLKNLNDLDIIRKISYNLYKGSKLFDYNHREIDYPIDIDFVNRFIKETYNFSLS